MPYLAGVVGTAYNRILEEWESALVVTRMRTEVPIMVVASRRQGISTRTLRMRMDNNILVIRSKGVTVMVIRGRYQLICGSEGTSQSWARLLRRSALYPLIKTSPYSSNFPYHA